MKKGFISVLVLLTVFAMISCHTSSSPGVKITISFSLENGPGAKPANVILIKGDTLGDNYPVMAGDATHVFLGWFDGDQEILPDTPLNATVTLTARWDIITDEPFVPPANWVGFNEAEILNAGFYVGNGGSPDDCEIIKNSDGTYTVTVKTRSDGLRQTVVWFTFDETEGEDGPERRVVFRNGWYASFELPEGGTVHPAQVDIVATDVENGSNPGPDWSNSQNSNVTGHNPALFDEFGNVIGELTMSWRAPEDQPATRNLITFAIWFTWDPVTTEGQNYSFIIKEIKVLPSELRDEPIPGELEAWEPGEILGGEAQSIPASGWTDVPTIIQTNGYPAGGTVETKTGGGYTVTIKTRADGQTEVVLASSNTAFRYKDGYYLSIDLPVQTAASTMKVKDFYAIPVNTGDAWTYSTLVAQEDKWLQGSIDLCYEHAEFNTNFTAMKLYITWHPGVVADQDYTFTVKEFKVKTAISETPVIQSISQTNAT